jgi:predicted deacylase
MQRKEFFSKKFSDQNAKEFTVTYCRITGSAPGPTLTLLAGQHGMEHSGPNILHQFIKDVDPDSFKGVILVCPCANPMALEMDYEIYPEGEDTSKINEYFYSQFRHNHCVFNLGRGDTKTWFNMNRLWNRKTIYGVAGKVAKWLWDEIIVKADVVVDMHCLQSDKPLIYNSGDCNVPWAKCFGIEAIIMCAPEVDEYNAHNLMRQVNSKPGKYGFCVEFSKQHGLKQSEYPLGVKGIDNMMKALKMKDGDIIHERPVYVVEYETPVPMEAGQTGHVRYFPDLYGEVKKDDKVYEIWDAQTLETLEEGLAPIDGIVGGICHKPVIKTGDGLCWIAPAVKVAESGKKVDKPVIN